MTDARRAENGYGRLTLRLRLSTLAKLEAEATMRGMTRSALIERALDWVGR